MNFYNVLKKIDALEANTPKQQITESTQNKTSVILEEGLDTGALRMLAGTQPNTLAECGMPTMGAMMPPSMPASLNMSAGNAGEIVAMVRGLMDLAATDKPSIMPMGAPMPDLMGMGGIHHHDEPLHAEPVMPPMGAAKIPDVKGMDDPIDSAIGASDEIGGATDLDTAGDDDIMNLIKKIRTGEPVKVTTDSPVKVTTDQDVKKSSDDISNDKKDEEARPYDNSPNEKVKAYNPNDMADLRDKVSAGDKEYTPPGSGDNPLPKADKEKKKDESLEAFEAQLFNEYKKFVSEGKEKCCCATKGKAKCPVHGDMDESQEKEGNAFGKAVRDAKRDGKDKVKVGGEEYPVKESDHPDEKEDKQLIKKMVKQKALKQERMKEGAKPDFLDLDNDGDKKEPMKKAAKEKKVAEAERTMSRAAKGYEKYGKKGMMALAKAGKEGKSLDKIRDKYNKYD